MDFEPVIGLEIHVQLKTETKMFCGCSARTWKAEPNTHVCPVCLGLPGALPVLNRKAVEQAIKVGLALKCKINRHSHFERKNYFYPDLPKGFQVSQYRVPLAVGGEFNGVRITRAHLEEDTAKSIYTVDSTLLDFNKSGIPLLEIVSEPEIHSVEAAVTYTKEIQGLMRRLGVSDADMEKGQMRLEGNVSMSQGKLPDYRVEIKNINSFRFLRGALKYEIERQTETLVEGRKLTQETRGYDEKRGVTFTQRGKEEAHDYRYFPEPDLPPLEIGNDEISRLQASLPKPKSELIDQLIQTHKLNKKDAEILVKERIKHDYFRSLMVEGMAARDAANLVINRPEVLDVEPSELVKQLQEEESEKISGEDILRDAIRSVIKANPQPVEDFRSGKEAALKFLVGQVMRETEGKANPQMVENLLKDFV